ncbi:MAG: hypothetical protein FWE33_01425 [Defluviitaleaceae bacterium]|nr:hypothetical protein [Defluviitaleaceae bacterium]
MEGFINNIAAAFGLSCKTISREKFGNICNTNKGLVRIQKWQANQIHTDNILFAHEVKEHLVKQDFDGVDRFFVASAGLPYHKNGDEIFTATVAYNSHKAEFANPQDFLATVASLGEMHKILTNPNFTATPKKKLEPVPANKAYDTITSFKKKMLKAGKFSEFDMLFLKGYDKFSTHIIAWNALGNDILGHNKYVCHNLLKEENIHIEAKPIFTNFVNAGFGHYLHDLVYIIKRYLKAHPMGEIPLADVIKAYKTGNDTQDFDIETFKALLLYPDKFIKISRDYYSKKRSFAPKTYLTHIEQCFERGNAIENYLR